MLSAWNTVYIRVKRASSNSQEIVILEFKFETISTGKF